MTYRYTQCGEDNPNFRTNSFYPAYPNYDWGVLLGWAWGLSRVVDYLETQPFVDTNKIIALGHSRLGKLDDGRDGIRRTHFARRARRFERRGHGRVSFLRAGSRRQGRHRGHDAKISAITSCRD